MENKVDTKKNRRISCGGFFVPRVGVEPTRLAALGPKPSASANSATPAYHCPYQFLLLWMLGFITGALLYLIYVINKD